MINKYAQWTMELELSGTILWILLPLLTALRESLILPTHCFKDSMRVGDNVFQGTLPKPDNGQRDST